MADNIEEKEPLKGAPTDGDMEGESAKTQEEVEGKTAQESAAEQDVKESDEQVLSEEDTVGEDTGEDGNVPKERKSFFKKKEKKDKKDEKIE